MRACVRATTTKRDDDLSSCQFLLNPSNVWHVSEPNERMRSPRQRHWRMREYRTITRHPVSHTRDRPGRTRHGSRESGDGVCGAFRIQGDPHVGRVQYQTSGVDDVPQCSTILARQTHETEGTTSASCRNCDAAVWQGEQHPCRVAVMSWKGRDSFCRCVPVQRDDKPGVRTATVASWMRPESTTPRSNAATKKQPTVDPHTAVSECCIDHGPSTSRKDVSVVDR